MTDTECGLVSLTSCIWLAWVLGSLDNYSRHPFMKKIADQLVIINVRLLSLLTFESIIFRRQDEVIQKLNTSSMPRSNQAM